MLSADAVFSDIYIEYSWCADTRIKISFSCTEEQSISLFIFSYNKFNFKQNKFISCLNNFPKFTKFEHSISAVILRKRSRLNCNFCKGHSGDVSVLQQFIMPPTFIGRTI